VGLFSKKEYIYTEIKLNDLLPIGSIVKITGDENLYIIHNYRGIKKHPQKPKTYIEVDYWCYRYPYGDYPAIMENGYEPINIGINQTDIQEVIFVGYSTEERLELLTSVEKLENGKKN